MPTEQRLGLEEVECVFPMSNAAGQQDEPETVGTREAGPLDLPMEDDQLLSEQGVLGPELGFAAEQVGSGGKRHRRAGRLSDLEKNLFEHCDKVPECLD